MHTTDDRDPVEALAAEFVERRRRGESPTIEEYEARNPELAEQIRELFPAVAAMESLKLAHEHSREKPSAKPGRIPARLGDYRILGEIGRGGMGVVYAAEQESLGRRVAVKILLRQPASDERRLQRFLREARSAARLHHTNIVPVFGVGEHEGHHYFVMQFIDGVGLDEVVAQLRAAAQPADGKSTQTAQETIQSAATLRASEAARLADSLRSGRFQTHDDQPAFHDRLIAWHATPSAPQTGASYWHAVARICQQAAAALQYAHDQGVLHRDVKPANLLLDSHGIVWVADFGLAKALEHDDLSRTGDILGTLRYMAPEQLQGQADARSDVFSLGLTLYELLTLQGAYRDSQRKAAWLRAERDRDPIPPRQIDGRIPRDLETIVLTAIAPEPDRRYQTAAELAADLERFLTDRPVHARRISMPARCWRWCRRNPALAMSSGAAAALLVTVAVVASAGYVRTNRALASELQQRRKAEATLQISLEALDRVYQSFAPDRLGGTLPLTLEGNDGESWEVTASPVLSRHSAALLEELLQFYDRFASQDIDNEQLRIEAAKANRRMGDIHRRLGHYDRAAADYQRAIDRYRDLDSTGTNREYQVDIARIQNELGAVYRSEREFGQARDTFQAALEALKPLAADRSDAIACYELARTYYLLSQRQEMLPGGGPPSAFGPMGPPGPRSAGGPRGRFGPPGDRRPDGPQPRGGPPFDRGPPIAGPGVSREQELLLTEAISILQELADRDTRVPEYRHLLALCFRDRARDLRHPDAQQAVELLEALRQEYPGVPQYKSDLAETFAKIDPQAPRQRAIEQLQRAIEIGEGLVAEHPNEPPYSSSLATMHFKLALVLRDQANASAPDEANRLRDSAEEHLRRGAELEAHLVKMLPDPTSSVIWMAIIQGRLAEIMHERGQSEAAIALLKTSTDSLDEQVKQDDSLLLGHIVLAENYGLMARILQRQDKGDESREAHQQMEQHRRRLPPRGFGPPPRERRDEK